MIFFKHHIISLVTGLLFFWSAAIIQGQDRFPENGILFDNSSIARVDITIDPDSLAMILQDGNERSDREYMATFTFTRGAFSETVDSVGFRLRGNTSRFSAKKSFKVSLNTFIRGQKFDGVEKINLNGEHNDPSMSRALLSWYLFREAGVPGSRANHVRLYINEEYRGLYINVEHVDEEFLDLRFDNNDGNLYKCLWPADLNYRGALPAAYKFMHEGRRAYALKRNLGTDDYSDLARFIDVLNNSDPGNLPKELSRVFNINIFLKYLAVEVLTGHWDAYSFNKNNYYLYYNEGTRKFEFIPYDPDNTFGISWFDDDWSSRNIYNWSHEWEPRPLVENLLQVEMFRDRFSFYMQRLIESVYNISTLEPFLDSVREQIRGAAADDLYRGMDYGYNYQDFHNSFESAAGAHVRRGLKPFITVRSSSAASQLSVNKIDPIVTLLHVNNPDLLRHAEVGFLVEDDDAIHKVLIWFASDGNFTAQVPVYEGNGNYRATHPGLSSDGVLRFYMEATDKEGNSTRDPEEGWYSIYYGTTTALDYRIVVQKQVSIYPNPVNSVLYINLKDFSGNFVYKIYDTSGRIVDYGEAEGPDHRLEPAGHLSNGLYLLEVIFAGSGKGPTIEYEKFILNR